MKIGELVIGLRADVAQIQRDMNDAKASVSSSMKDIKSSVDFAKTALESLGVAVGLNEFKSMISDVIEFKARLADLSTQTGIGVETLGALNNVGKLSRTTLEDITSASAKLSKAVATQNEDSKGAAQAIAALGLNFAQFKSLRPEEQLQTVARAMAEFQDGTGKTAAAMLLFGKTGATMLPFLHDLAEATNLASKQTTEASRQAKEFEDNLVKLKIAGDEWKNSLANSILPTLVQFTTALLEARRAQGGLFAGLETAQDVMGHGVGGALAATREQIEHLEQVRDRLVLKSRDDPGFIANLLGTDHTASDLVTVNRNLDDLTRKKEALLAIQQKEALESGAGITDTRSGQRAKTKPSITGLDADTAKARDLYAELIKTINERLAQGELETQLGRKLTEGEKLRQKALSDIDTGVVKATTSERAYADAKLKQIIVNDKLALEREESRKENDAALDKAGQQRDATLGQVKALEQQLEEFGKTREELQALAISRDLDLVAQKRGIASALDNVAALGQMRQSLLDEAQALEDLAKRKQKLADAEASERNDPVKGANRALRDYLSDITRAGDATEAAVGNSLRGLEDTMVTTLRGGDIKNAWKSLIDQMLSEATRLLIIRPLLQSILTNGGGPGSQYSGGWMSLIGAIGGLFTGSGYSYNGDASGSAFSQTGDAIRGRRASGGPVGAFQSYLVGEKGPEILRMGSAGGTVVPNGAGQPITQNINVHVDARSDQAAVAQQTATAVQQGNRQMVELLRSRGVL